MAMSQQGIHFSFNVELQNYNSMNTHSISIMPFGKVNLSLTAEAIGFLSETTNGTSHFAILGQLIKSASVTPSSTSKRGNVITLGVGQVECSIHSCCAQFGIGRKKFEAIMRQMEQHGIIRMHRSRLATVADMTCITSWLLPDGSTVSNGIDGYPADHSSDGQPDNYDATPHDSSHIHDGKADAASVLSSQSLSDTGRPSALESSVTPMGTPGTPDRSVNRGYATVMLSDLFAGQECRVPLKPQSQNGSMVKND